MKRSLCLLIVLVGISASLTGGILLAKSVFHDRFGATIANPLVASSVSNSLIPTQNDSIDLGSSSQAFGSLYVASGVKNTYSIGQSFSQISSLSTGLSQPRCHALRDNYLYCVNGNAGSFSIIDVSDPLNPALLSTVAVGTSPRLGDYANGYVYIPNSGSGNLSIVDVGRPNAPFVAATTTLPTASPQLARVSGNQLFIPHLGGTMDIFDITDPVRPVLASAISGLNAPVSLQIQGKYVYVPTQDTTNQLIIIDVTNPRSPVNIGNYQFTNFIPFVVELQGRYAYVQSFGNSLNILDISNPTAPSLVSSSTVADAGATGASIFVSGRYLYGVHRGTNTMSVTDISSPSSPFNITTSVSVNGDPRDLIVRDGLAYVSEITNSALRIFDMKGSKFTSISVDNLKAGNSEIQGDEIIGRNLLVGNGINSGYGGILSFGPLSVAASNTTSTIAGIVVVSSTAFFNGNLLPSLNNSVSLGGTTQSWKDFYSSGTAYLFGVTSTGSEVTFKGVPENTGALANVCINSSGRLFKDSSLACLSSNPKDKENLSDLKMDYVKTIMSLEPKEWDWKSTVSRTGHDIGFDAEQAEGVDERLVAYTGDGDLKGFRYQEFVAVLTGALQEQQKKIVSLEDRIRSLEQKQEVRLPFYVKIFP